MNRLIITILILLLWTAKLLGQVQYEVKNVLASKDFIAFKKFADNLSDTKKNIFSYWESLRDLTPDFQEGVFIFEISIPDKDKPPISSVYEYRVNIISTNTTIVYYELSEKKNKKVGNEWVPYYEIIDSLKDQVALDKLKVTFKSIYQSELNESELFVIDFVYGTLCNNSGTKPKGRKQIDEWVKDKNKTEILTWLTSTNTEKQVYAVDGLSQLKNAGVALTEEEVKIINFVCNKNGTMYVCGGCIHSRDDIRKVTKNFRQYKKFLRTK